MLKNEPPLEEFDLKLAGDGINIEKKIDRQTAAAVMAAVLGVHPTSTEPSQAGVVGVQHQPEEQISLREFLDEVKAVGKRDQIVAIGYYICHHEVQSNFSREDVKARFSAAREPMPANFPRDFNQAIKIGMIAEAHKHAGRFYVTKTGVQAVERHFTKAPK
jgi:NDP-sugar pyrophosphorylase family protein